MTDYPQYSVEVTLDNGVTFSVTVAAQAGLPSDLEDQLAAVAAGAIRDFNWSGVTELTPQANSATVVLTRQDVANTNIPVT